MMRYMAETLPGNQERIVVWLECRDVPTIPDSQVHRLTISWLICWLDYLSGLSKTWKRIALNWQYCIRNKELKSQYNVVQASPEKSHQKSLIALNYLFPRAFKEKNSHLYYSLSCQCWQPKLSSSEPAMNLETKYKLCNWSKAWR